MGHFPLFLDLTGKPVLLVGHGPQCDEKAARLAPFGADLRRVAHLTEGDLEPAPVMVLAGDCSPEEAQAISGLCRSRGIPVNIADRPALCSFYFPALISRGPLTVGISTAGVSPAAAAVLRQQLEEQLPDRTEEILLWANRLRGTLSRTVLKAAVAEALNKNRPLTEAEIQVLVRI